jgi:hypothetical protein
MSDAEIVRFVTTDGTNAADSETLMRGRKLTSKGPPSHGSR